VSTAYELGHPTRGFVSAEAQAEIDQAEAEAREAAELVDALAERVKAGDPDVSPGQLGEQRQLAEFAALRVEAARRSAEAKRAKARHVAYRDLVAEVVRFPDVDTAVVDAFGEALEAARKLWDAAAGRSAALRDLGTRAGALVAEARERDELGMLRVEGGAGVLGADARYLGFIDPAGTARRVHDVHPAEMVGLVLRRLFNEDAANSRAAGGLYPSWPSVVGQVHTPGAEREFPHLAAVEVQPRAATGPAPESYTVKHRGRQDDYDDHVGEATVRFVGGEATLPADHPAVRFYQRRRDVYEVQPVYARRSRRAGKGGSDGPAAA
jgi:hypothetical protein